MYVPRRLLLSSFTSHPPSPPHTTLLWIITSLSSVSGDMLALVGRKILAGLNKESKNLP